jgi:hypothetical protein
MTLVRSKSIPQALIGCGLILGLLSISSRIERQVMEMKRSSGKNRRLFIDRPILLLETNVSEHREHLHVMLSADGKDDALGFSMRPKQMTQNGSDSITIDEAWPPLDRLIGDLRANVTGNVQFLLDFAIIAHPKTATSAMLHWFRLHPEIQVQTHENHALAAGKPAELVANLYQMEPGQRFKRGYKAPRDLIVREALLSIAKYWPRTKLIVGLRHPVLWFESFYNFRIHNGYNMPPAEALIGPLQRGMVGVATDEAKFHWHFDGLGKTSHTPGELKLLSWGDEKPPPLPKLTNPVFLYEINQLRDANETRAAIFCADLAQYLGLSTALKPMSIKRGPIYPKAIDICEPRYGGVRLELMKHAKESATWIRRYFVQSPDVTVSVPEYFHRLMTSWLADPCEA